jgi:phosphoglycolate phosphatase-like HAD superfamily hydrolase
MVQDPKKTLLEIKATKDFFVGIDSDGCAFDTMEIKHKECFCPNTILHWELQSVSKYAREVWDFVNLYSDSRGCNRFHALIRTIDLLGKRNEVIDRKIKLPDLTPLVEWTKTETKLGVPALAKYAERTNDPIIKRALDWSVGINQSVEKMVYGIAPFPHMKESLAKLSKKADSMVVSQTPTEAITREWKENGIAEFVSFIAGQEAGTKTEHLKYGAKGKYDDDKILMIGDAPGDMKAAKINDVLFYPINPGHEEDSWKRFYEEGLDKFFAGTFAGAYEEKLIKEFESYLPKLPVWEKQ